MTVKSFKETAHQEIKYESKFAIDLVSMDSRILPRDTLNDVVFYKPGKNAIMFPYCLPSVAHEVAHVVEMNNFSRLVQDDFGMKLFFCKPSPQMVFAAASRETRVRAIERHMGETSYLLHNNLWKSYCKESCPFGRFKTYSDVEDWYLDLDEKTYKAWSLDRIRHEWEIRLNYIRDWMETK